MAILFSHFLAKAREKDLEYQLTNSAVAWFRRQVSTLVSSNVSALRGIKKANPGQVRFQSRVIPGDFYMFAYNPKGKDELPYYDRLPITLVIGIYKDGFLGLNMHYLPREVRAKFMDALSSLLNNYEFNEKTRILATYKILKAGRKKFKPYGFCIKRYLGAHVQSQFLYIEPLEWDRMLMLPTEKFEKENKDTVWQDARKFLS